MVKVGEFVDDAIKANTRSNWNTWFSNEKYLKEYATPERLSSYKETIKLCENEGANFQNGNIIDVGCGTGHLLRELKKSHPNIDIFGTDFSEESILVSKQVNEDSRKDHFFVMDIYNIPNEQFYKYDYVICSEVLEHLLHPEEALKNIAQLTNENGVLIITVPNGRVDSYGGHINFWSPESWQVFIENNLDKTTFTHKFKLFNNNRNIFVLVSKNEQSNK